jgi:predicted O-linked N-acetylglucosamine transferase (SPINDLY family)
MPQCSVDVYINKAISLVENKELRKSLRSGLRNKIKNNPLGQTQRFVRNFEAKNTEVLLSGS